MEGTLYPPVSEQKRRLSLEAERLKNKTYPHPHPRLGKELDKLAQQMEQEQDKVLLYVLSILQEQANPAEALAKNLKTYSLDGNWVMSPTYHAQRHLLELLTE